MSVEFRHCADGTPRLDYTSEARQVTTANKKLPNLPALSANAVHKNTLAQFKQQCRLPTGGFGQLQTAIFLVCTGAKPSNGSYKTVWAMLIILWSALRTYFDRYYQTR